MFNSDISSIIDLLPKNKYLMCVFAYGFINEKFEKKNITPLDEKDMKRLIKQYCVANNLLFHPTGQSFALCSGDIPVYNKNEVLNYNYFRELV